jgi:hypothetical protein
MKQTTKSFKVTVLGKKIDHFFRWRKFDLRAFFPACGFPAYKMREKKVELRAFDI